MAEPTARSFLGELKRLKELWPYLRPEKRYLIGAVSLIPLIALLQMAMPLAIRYTIDHGIGERDYGVLTRWAGIFLVLNLVEYLTRSSQSILTSLSVHRMILRLRETLIAHVLKLKGAYHDRSLSGAMVTRATGDFDSLSESLNQGVLTSVVDCAVLIGSLVGLFLLDWRLALIALVMLPLIGGIVSWFSKALKTALMNGRRTIGVLNAYTQECLYGHTTIKLLTAESAAQAKQERLSIENRNTQMSSVILDAAMYSVIDGIASIAVGVTLWVGVQQMSARTALTAGVMVAFVQYIQQLFEPLKQLGTKMALLQGAFTAIDRIFGVMHQRDFIEGTEAAPRLQGAVTFDNVRFQYRKQGEGEAQGAALKGLSFSMRAGESLALVGATGSGKSTTIKLLTKLYDGYDGSIRIDGREVRDLEPLSLKRQLGIVPQDIVLFDASIAFNISLGTEGISRSDIEAAARAVGADSFISRLPGGLDFHLTERGANLSHGQRQLIAFARALARNPAMVILDEATSSVDPESEAIIQRAIAEMVKGRSVIVIAHRLSTVRQCDLIVVIDHGRAAESGTHESLLAHQGLYHALHHSLV